MYTSIRKMNDVHFSLDLKKMRARFLLLSTGISESLFKVFFLDVSYYYNENGIVNRFSEGKLQMR